MTDAAFSAPSQDAGSTLPFDARTYQNLINAITANVMHRAPIALTVTGTTTLVATCTPALPEYRTGNWFWWVAPNGCTGPTSIAVSELAAKNLRDRAGNVLVSGAWAAGDLVVGTYEGTHIRLVGNYDFAAALASGGMAPGFMSGLAMATNASDPNNDIDVAPGFARSEDNSRDIILAGPLTKRLDAVWAQGTNQGAILQSANLAGTVTVTTNTSVSGTGTSFLTNYIVGDVIQTAAGQARRIVTITSNIAMTVESAWTSGESAVTYKRGGKARNSCYRCFVIRNDANGSADVACSTRDTPVDLPAGWSQYTRFAYQLTDASGNNRAVNQFGNTFLLSAAITQVNATFNGTGFGLTTTNTYATELPPGTRAVMRLVVSLIPGGTNPSSVVVFPAAQAAPTGGYHVVVDVDATRGIADAEMPLDVSSAFKLQTVVGVTTQIAVSLYLLGWIDGRGTGIGGIGTAALSSPAFMGTPTAPTAADGTNTTQLATTAFVQNAFTLLKNGVSSAFDTLSEIATSLGLKAPLASPALTGTPTAPTPALSDYSTKISTTQAAVRAAWEETYGTTHAGYCAGMTVVPDRTRRRALAALYDAIPASAWAKCDVAYVIGAHDAQGARLNLVGPGGSFNASAVNSPSFTTDRGYAGNGSTSYLNTGFTPSTAGGHFLVDNACIYSWSLDDAAEAGPLFGCVTSTGIICNPRNVSNQFTARLNDTVTDSVSIDSSRGSFCVNRPNSTDKEFWHNGKYIDTKPRASGSLPANAICIHKSNSSYGTRRCPFLWISSSLTPAEIVAIDAAVLAYLVAIGAETPRIVYPKITGFVAGGESPEGFNVKAFVPSADNVVIALASTSASEDDVVFESDALTVDIYEDDFLDEMYHVSADVVDLPAGTGPYYYNLRIDGLVDPDRWQLAPQLPAPPGTAYNSSHAVLSCYKPASSTTVSVSFEKLVTLGIHWVDILGDFPYMDMVTDNIGMVRRLVAACYEHVSVALLIAKVFISKSDSDHCAAGNDCDLKSYSGAAVQIFENARTVNTEFLPQHEWADAERRCMARAVVRGRVLHLTIDQRHQRWRTSAGVNATCMGNGTYPPGSFDQVTWFKDTVLAWCGSGLIDRVEGKMEGGSGAVYDNHLVYAPAEFADIQTFIRDYCTVPFRWVGGDNHNPSIDAGTNMDYATGGGVITPLLCSSPIYVTTTSTLGGPAEWLGEDTHYPDRNKRNFIHIRDFQSAKYWTADLWCRDLVDLNVMELVKSVDSRDLVNDVEFVDTTLTVAHGATLSVQIAQAHQGPAGTISVDWDSSDGQSGTIILLPNKRWYWFDYVAPIAPGSYTIALSNPIGCTLGDDDVATVTVT